MERKNGEKHLKKQIEGRNGEKELERKTWREKKGEKN